MEWDEPGCCDKQNRVSPWEVETPESLFIFPSLTSGLKRPLHAGFLGAETEWGHLIKRPLLQVPENGNGDLPYSLPNMCPEKLMKMLMKPQFMNHTGTFLATLQQESATKLDPLQDVKIMHNTNNQKSQLISSEGRTPIQPQPCHDQPDVINSIFLSKAILPGKLNYLSEYQNRMVAGVNTDKLSLEPEVSTDELSQLTSTGECNEEKPSAACPTSLQNLVNQPTCINQNQDLLQSQNSSWPLQSQMEPLINHSQQLDVLQSDASNLNGLLPSLDTDEWKFYPSSQPLGGMFRSPGPVSMFGLQDASGLFSEAVNVSLPSMGQEIWDHELNNLNIVSQPDQLTTFPHQDPCNISSGLRDAADESYNQSGIYSCANADISNGGSAVVDPSVSSTILDDLSTVKNVNFHNPSDYLVGNFSSSQDVQSQITTASLPDSQAISRQDVLDNSGVTSSSNMDFDEASLLQNSSWQQVVPLVRTYTKVQKKGSVGRSIDVTGFKNYDELCSAIECMFGLEGLLNDPRGSGWKLVYVDYENDVLLVGDDPWEQFIRCVRCIKILSPSEVQKMSEEGMKLLNSAAMQG